MKRKKKQQEEPAGYKELFGVEPPKEMKKPSLLRIMAPMLIAMGVKWAIIIALTKQLEKEMR